MTQELIITDNTLIINAISEAFVLDIAKDLRYAFHRKRIVIVQTSSTYYVLSDFFLSDVIGFSFLRRGLL